MMHRHVHSSRALSRHQLGFRTTHHLRAACVSERQRRHDATVMFKSSPDPAPALAGPQPFTSTSSLHVLER